MTLKKDALVLTLEKYIDFVVCENAPAATRKQKIHIIIFGQLSRLLIRIQKTLIQKFRSYKFKTFDRKSIE
jgi:hypothetical protein